MISLPVALLLLAMSADAEMPRIGIIDFYGLRHVTEQQARKALQITEGDPAPDSISAARRRLEAIPGVVRARLNGVCCETGKSILYVGIEEKGAPSLQFRKAPQGVVRLAGDVVQSGRAFEEALSTPARKFDDVFWFGHATSVSVRRWSLSRIRSSARSFRVNFHWKGRATCS